jgi:pimeloyl-ACP methyl ester carboxylesterase
MFSGKKNINGIEIYIEHANLTPISNHGTKLSPKQIPYVIMHGHSANHNFMKPIFDVFKEQGLPVLMFDLRGHGWSQKTLSGQYKLDIAVEDLHQLFEVVLKGEFGYEKFYLSGHSMGGFIAMKYALKYPETLEKLILLSTSPKMADNFARKIGLKVVINGFKKNYEKWFGMKRKDHLRIGMEFFPQWSDTTLMPDPKAVIEFLEDMVPYNLENKLSQIKVPTFVCMARQDGTMTMKMFNKLLHGIPGAKFHLFEQYKHNITIEARGELPDILIKFLYY